MQIGMVLDLPFPPDLRVENEALSLIKQGHQVVLFTPNYTHLPLRETYKGIEIVRFSAGRLHYKLSALACDFPFYTNLMCRKLEKVISLAKVEVLHVHDMVIADAVIKANKSGVPMILDLHENRPEIMRDYKHVNSFPGRILINLNKWVKKYYQLAHTSDKVVVVTEAAANDIAEVTGRDLNDIVVVPNSVSLSAFLEAETNQVLLNRMTETFNVLYLGDTSLRRGTDTAIRAIDLLRAEIPTIKLWLVGRSSSDRQLMELSDSLGVRDFIAYEGWQDSSLIPTYIQGASVCISPLKRNRHHDTTYANKLFQYMGVGRPLVVSDCTAQAELILSIGCGLVHCAGDERDLSSKILELYKNPSLSKELGFRGKEAVRGEWNWDNTVTPLLKMYANLNVGA